MKINDPQSEVHKTSVLLPGQLKQVSFGKDYLVNSNEYTQLWLVFDDLMVWMPTKITCNNQCIPRAAPQIAIWTFQVGQ